MDQADDLEQLNGTEYIEVGKKLPQALDSPRQLCARKPPHDRKSEEACDRLNRRGDVFF
jgi:hypothetical protein